MFIEQSYCNIDFQFRKEGFIKKYELETLLFSSIYGFEKMDEVSYNRWNKSNCRITFHPIEINIFKAIYRKYKKVVDENDIASG